jgi:MgtC family
LIAGLGGAAVGLERELSGHASGPRARFAGIRTLTLLGLLAGLDGWLWSEQMQLLAALLLAAAAALIVAAYAAASRVEVDGTTEVAALVVLPAGIVAGMHELRLASATFAITTLLLVEKSRLQKIRICSIAVRVVYPNGTVPQRSSCLYVFLL